MTFNLLLVQLALIGCATKEAKLPPEPKAPEELEIIWRTPIVPNPATDYTISLNPVLYDSLVIFGTDHQLNGINAPVLFLDTATGEIIDTWSDYLVPGYYYNDDHTCSSDNYLILSSLSTIDCVNLATRQTQWQTFVPTSTPGIYAHNKSIYRGISYQNEDRAAILRTPYNNLSWDTVFSFHRTDRFLPGFDAMGFGELANGDEVIVWKNRGFVSGNGTMMRTDIFAFNLTADSLLWRNQELIYDSGDIPLKISDGKVYGLVEYRAFCINLESGAKEWVRDIREFNPSSVSMNFYTGDLYIYQDGLILAGDSDELICLNKKTGGLRFIKQDVCKGDFQDRFTYFEGKLFFASGGLQVVDAFTGELSSNEAFANAFPNLRSKIVIDPNRRVMYFHNSREAFCVKIPNNLD